MKYKGMIVRMYESPWDDSIYVYEVCTNTWYKDEQPIDVDNYDEFILYNDLEFLDFIGELV